MIKQGSTKYLQNAQQQIDLLSLREQQLGDTQMANLSP